MLRGEVFYISQQSAGTSGADPVPPNSEVEKRATATRSVLSLFEMRRLLFALGSGSLLSRGFLFLQLIGVGRFYWREDFFFFNILLSKLIFLYWEQRGNAGSLYQKFCCGLPHRGIHRSHRRQSAVTCSADREPPS